MSSDLKFSLFTTIVVLALIVAACFLGPLLPWLPHPNVQDLARIAESPSWEHWFGTDQLGRDLLARVLCVSVFERAIGFNWLLGVASLLLSVLIAIIASIPPVRRATRIDPAIVLREE